MPRNFDKAAELYEQAAKKGLAPAMFELGMCYTHGMGVRQNYLRAANHFLEASKAGYRPARTFLNLLYAYNLIPPQFMAQSDAEINQQKAEMPFELEQAITNNDLEAVRKWAQNNDINQRYGIDEITPVMYAIDQKKFTLARDLIFLMGADITLFDRKYLTVFDKFEGMPHDLVLQLLKYRPRVRHDRIELVIQDCLEEYQPGVQHASENLGLLNHAAGLLVGVSNSARLLLDNKDAYLVHLNSRNETRNPNLEGMTSSNVLELKVFDNLQLIMQLHHGQLVLPDTDPQQLKEQLIREIQVAMEVHQWEALSNYVEHIEAADDIKTDIKQAVVDNFITHLGQLKDGEEMLFRTGYGDLAIVAAQNHQPQYGHCIYVAFHRRGDELIVRVDNLWPGDINTRHRLSGQQTHHTHQDKYYPYLVWVMDFSAVAGLTTFDKDLVHIVKLHQLEKFSNYVLGLLNARKLPSQQALALIYRPYNQDRILKYQFPDCGPQRIGNCAVKNYYIGELYRLGRPLLSQLRPKEKELVQKIAEQKIPDRNEQIQRAQQLLLRGRPEAPPAPLPSHEQLMQKMAACLQVNLLQVRQGSLVEQTLVAMAGIQSTLTSAAFQREVDGTTCFVLSLTTNESYAFYDYYHAHFPDLILRMTHLSATKTRIIVDTRCLCDLVVPALGKQHTNCAIQ